MWKLKCLLCDRFETESVVEGQKHGTEVHKLTSTQLKRQDLITIKFGIHYKWKLRDGREWMEAEFHIRLLSIED